MDNRNDAFEAYIKEIGNEQILSAETERELAGKIQNGDNRALDKLSRSHLKFVVFIANQYRGRGVDVADLVCEGNVALLKAARKYDASHGNRFASYASPFIRRAIEEAIEQQAGLYRVPRDMNTAAERKCAIPLSADAPLGGRENVNLLSVIPDTASPIPGEDNTGTNTDLMEKLAACMPRLDYREKQVMSLLYGIECNKLTMAEAGTALGIKRERVRQIRDKAMRKIRGVRL